jgi:hypothetical protein
MRAALVLAIAVLTGCGDGGGATTSVQGKITYEGKPVTTGVINFQPARGQPLGGGIQADGSYAFDLPPGDYRVRIDAPPAVPAGYKEGGPVPKLPPRLVPERYADYNTSDLTATVSGEERSQSIDFVLP